MCIYICLYICFYVYIYIYIYISVHVCVYIYVCVSLYVYICMCVCMCMSNFIKQYRHFLSIYFCVGPFKLPHWFYDICGELVNNPSIINWFPCAFCPILGHYPGWGLHCKSNVTFTCILLLCKNRPFIVYTHIVIYSFAVS